MIRSSLCGFLRLQPLRMPAKNRKVPMEKCFGVCYNKTTYEGLVIRC